MESILLLSHEYLIAKSGLELARKWIKQNVDEKCIVLFSLTFSLSFGISVCRALVAFELKNKSI